MMATVADLIARWHQDAALLRKHGAIEAAVTKEVAAAELELFERERALEALPLTQAAAESGYTTDHLARLISEGRLEDIGEKRAPRVRRGDLPRKPRARAKPLDPTEPEFVAQVMGWRTADDR